MINNSESLNTLIQCLDESLRLKIIDVLASSNKSGLGLDQVLNILNSFENDKISSVSNILGSIWEHHLLSSVKNGELLQRAYFSYCFSSNILFFYGGKCGIKDSNKILHKFNLVTNVIETNSEWQGPGKRKSAALAIKSEELLVLYGGKSGARYLNDLWKFDLKNEKWSEIKTKGQRPLAREGCLVFILSEKLFIYGGGNKKQIFSDCFWLDLQNEIWSPGVLSIYNEFLIERKKMAYCSVGLSVFMFGGLIKNGECCGCFDLFEFNEGFQVNVTKLPVRPCRRYAASLSEVRGILVMAGGKNSERTLCDVWIYNIKSEYWEEIECYNSISCRSGHCSMIYNEKCIIFGGWNNSHFSDNYLCSLSLPSSKENILLSHNDPIYSIYPKRLNTQYCVKLPPRPKLDHCLASSININDNQFVQQLNFFPSDLKIQTSQYQNDSCALLQICRTWVSLSISLHIKSTILFLQNKVCKLAPKNSLKKLFNLRRNNSDNEFHIRQKILNSWERVPTYQLNILKITIRPIMPQMNFIYDIIKFPSILTPFLKISPIVVIVTKYEDCFSVFICKQVNEEFLIFYTIFNKNLQVVFPNEKLAYACIRNILVNTHFKAIKEITETKHIDVFLYTDKFHKREENDILDLDGNSLAKIMERSGDLDVHVNKYRCINKPVNKELLQVFSGYKVYISTDQDFSVLMYYLGKLVYWKASENSIHCYIIEITDNTLINELTGQVHPQTAEKIFSLLTT